MRFSVRRLAPTAAGLCLAALTMGMAPATAPEGTATAPVRPFTVDDMLSLESFGTASISPDQTHVVFERRGGYETADRFDLTYLGAWQTSTLWIADAQRGPARRLLQDAEGRGHVLGPWSPSGRRLIVHRLQGDDWRTGVAEVATGSVRWLGLGVEPPIRGESVIWRSEDELLVLVRTDRRMPYDISGLAPGLEAMASRHDAVRRGHAAVSVWGGGAFAEPAGFAAETDLIRIDLRDGSRTVLARGRGLDMALSPRPSMAGRRGSRPTLSGSPRARLQTARTGRTATLDGGGPQVRTRLVPVRRLRRGFRASELVAARRYAPCLVTGRERVGHGRRPCGLRCRDPCGCGL